MFIRLNLPMNKKHHKNTAKYLQHTVYVVIPAIIIEDFVYDDMPDGYQLSRSDGFSIGEGFINTVNNPHNYGILSVRARVAYITGGAVPVLASEILRHKVSHFIDSVRNQSSESGETLHFKFLIRRQDDLTRELAYDFHSRIVAERMHDPARDWLQNTPRAQAFSMGTLLNVVDRPRIPLQRAETVFHDKMSLLVPVVYQALYKEEFQKIIIDELEGDDFQAKLIECPNSINRTDKAIGPSFNSTARAYIMFVDFNVKELVRPDIGNTLKVHLQLEDTSTDDSAALVEDSATPTEDGSTSAEDDPTPNEDGAENSDAESDSNSELGSEDGGDVYDDDDLAGNSDPLTWLAKVIDPLDITPPGHLTMILERRLQPNFEGPRKERPYVDVPLPTVNIRVATDANHLAQMITQGPSINVKLSIHYSRQGLKDQVRCADELFRGLHPQQKHIAKALLCHDPQKSPLKRVNLLALKGTSKINLTATFNNAQKKTYLALADTPEITLIHGPFGTGKTELCLTVASETMSNPSVKHQVIYAVHSNKQVDDAAARWLELLESNGIKGKTILRAHTLDGEKSQVYRYYDKQGKPQERFEVSDAFVAELTAFDFLAELSKEHREVRSRSDPRRVLESMSIAAAVHKKLTEGKTKALRVLRGMLKDYGECGFHGTDRSKRTEIKLGLNTVLAEVINEADGICVTLAGAAKVNMANNAHPVLFILDEAARVTELEAMILYASYRSLGFILAGDHKQMRATILSAGRWKDTVAPYLNPFENQGLLSPFERLIITGHEHHLLTIQHRCKGDIPVFPNAAFYHGEVNKAKITSAEKETLKQMRDFVKYQLGANKPTNRYAVNIEKSRCFKEQGGTSSINDAEIEEMVRDATLMSNDRLFNGRKIALGSFYKAQVTKLKNRTRDLKNVKVLEVDELIPTILAMTVDSSQGTQFDVMLLSFVQTRNVSFLGEPHRLCVALTRAVWILGIYTNFELRSSIDKRTVETTYIMDLFDDLSKMDHVIDRVSRIPNNTTTTCYNCSGEGHREKDCPEPKIPTCRNCRAMGDFENMRGHLSQDCQLYDRPLETVRCNECHEMGHYRRACPQVTCSRCNAQGHSEAACIQPKHCYRCRQPGHVRRQCKTVLTRIYMNEMMALQPGEFMPIPGQGDGQNTSAPAAAGLDGGAAVTGLGGGAADAADGGWGVAPAAAGLGGGAADAGWGGGAVDAADDGWGVGDAADDGWGVAPAAAGLGGGAADAGWGGGAADADTGSA